MELRHLRYFVAVAEELHFHRAAERLHVAQSAVSEQVRRLEQDLGVALFDRARPGVALTEPGVALLGEARRVLAGAEAARCAARNARTGVTSRLRVGYMPTALPGSVPRALGRLTASLPQLAAALEPGLSTELIARVRGGDLDAAVVSLPAPTTGLRTTALGDQRVVAVVPTGHHQATAAAVRLEQVRPERIVVLPRAVDGPFHGAVVAACHSAGVSPRLVELADGDIEHVLLTVASGTALALLPGSLAERYAAIGVRFVPLHGNPFACEVAVVTRRDTTHVLTAAFLRTVARTGVASDPRVPVAA